ncbi:hypothetical protein [Clostridium sp.]|uniref:hypothetical protein n=1 Tax=Clostridium sp. TaxID=1506 RepID=UPI002FDCDB24
MKAAVKAEPIPQNRADLEIDRMWRLAFVIINNVPNTASIMDRISCGIRIFW